MDLDELRRILRERQGGILALALRDATAMSILAELGVTMPRLSYPLRLFNFPVVIMGDEQPEGVIVNG